MTQIVNGLALVFALSRLAANCAEFRLRKWFETTAEWFRFKSRCNNSSAMIFITQTAVDSCSANLSISVASFLAVLVQVWTVGQYLIFFLNIFSNVSTTSKKCKSLTRLSKNRIISYTLHPKPPPMSHHSRLLRFSQQLMSSNRHCCWLNLKNTVSSTEIAFNL